MNTNINNGIDNNCIIIIIIGKKKKKMMDGWMDDSNTVTLRPQYQEVAPNSKKWQAALWRKIALTAPLR